jgi:hypothetical protein
MTRTITCLAIGFIMACVSSMLAYAESVCQIVQHGKSEVVFVAKPGKLSEFYSLINAREKTEAAKVLACAPSVGDKVIITDRGFVLHTIRVVSGQFSGCVGDVAMQSIGNCQ